MLKKFVKKDYHSHKITVLFEVYKTNFYVTAPTVAKGAAVVKRQIGYHDATLPPSALEKMDRNVLRQV